MPIEQHGYLTDLLGDRAVAGDRSARPGRPAVLPQPQLHRAALAVGRSRTTRPSRSGCAGRRACSTGTAARTQTYAAMMQLAGRQRRQGARRARRARAGATTRSSSSPATTAASGSPTTGRSPGARPSCSKAGCACRRSTAGRAARRPGAVSERAGHVDGLAADVPRCGGRRAACRRPERRDRHPPGHRRPALPERTLFWRFANHSQRAARRGRFKFLEIAGNAFLFDVVADPMERANLREREPAVFAELVRRVGRSGTPACCHPIRRPGATASPGVAAILGSR